MTMKKDKPTHGGARKGAGRKPKEKTKVMRIPVSLVPVVRKLIKEHNRIKPENIKQKIDDVLNLPF